MKKSLPFLAGMLTTALIGGLGVTALATTGTMTITVNPINIQVNGETFQPKDAQWADVPVFAYNGTTYAPLRALAEAYGLEVGYDAQANMATVTGDAAASGGVTGSDTAAYSLPDSFDSFEDFKSVWTITSHGDSGAFSAAPIPEIENDLAIKRQFMLLWNGTTKDKRKELMSNFLSNIKSNEDANASSYYVGFIFNGDSIGSASDSGSIVVKDIP